MGAQRRCFRVPFHAGRRQFDVLQATFQLDPEGFDRWFSGEWDNSQELFLSSPTVRLD